MNEFLRRFDTIRFVATWSIFRFFWEFFIFLNSNLNFKFGPVWNRPKPEPVRTGLTGNRSFRTGFGRVFFPTGHPKPLATGSGLPYRFDRLPVKIGQIQIWIQKTQFNRFVPVYQPVWPVYRWFKEIFRRLKNRSRCEIKGNFGMRYANININDHTKTTIYNHAYKYNCKKRAYKYEVIHLYTWNKSST